MDNNVLAIITLLLGLLGDAVIGIVVFSVTRKMAQSQQKKDEVEKVRHESKTQLELLHLQLVNAGNSLSYAVAMAVKRGTPNGEIEAGIKKYKEAKKAYFDYLTQIGIAHFEQEDEL